MRLRGAEVGGESEQRRLGVGRIAGAHAGVAVVIAGDRENRRRIVLVRLIELGAVELALSVEIDDVSNVIEKRRLVRRLHRFDLAFHGFSDRHLNIVAVNAAGITDDMKYELARLCSGGRQIRHDDAQRQCQIHVVGERRLLEMRIVLRA
jgi:hypothetical protein